MRICVQDEHDNITFLEVDALSTIEDVKALLEVHTQAPLASQALFYNNFELQDDHLTLGQLNVSEGDMFFMRLRSHQRTVRDVALEWKAYYNGNPSALQGLLVHNPYLAELILAEDTSALEQYVAQQAYQKQMQDRMQSQQVSQLNADPLDMEAQMKIEEMIQQKNINENLEMAHEFLPESFGQIVMLYVEVKVNGVPIQAFVDSGAQNTIMSLRCAERCNLRRLIDQKYQGIAVGVGQSRIVGRVHATQLEIGGEFFLCSFSILEDDKIDMLFGLDLLRRHRCCIDLANGILTLNGGQAAVPFLGEANISRTLSMNAQNVREEDIEKLTKLGFARTQAVRALKSSDGDVDKAASSLYSQEF